MIVRIVIGVGLLALGYFVGKEVGRTESVRDQLRSAADDEETPTELQSGRRDDLQVSPERHPADD